MQAVPQNSSEALRTSDAEDTFAQDQCQALNLPESSYGLSELNEIVQQLPAARGTVEQLSNQSIAIHEDLIGVIKVGETEEEIEQYPQPNTYNNSLSSEQVQLRDHEMQHNVKFTIMSINGVHDSQKDVALSNILQSWGEALSPAAKISYEQETKKSLENAYLIKNYHKQCEILAKLAHWHFEQRNYSAATKLFNGALAVIKEHAQDIPSSSGIETSLLNALKSIESHFFTEKLKISYKEAEIKARGINPQHRHSLLQLREEVDKRHKELRADIDFFDQQSSVKIQQLFKEIVEHIKGFIIEMVQNCINLMPTQPPCDYALIGTGSLAREEMTPYSDLECFILIAEDKPEYKQYFHQLSQLLELKIINLGETDLVKGQNLLPPTMSSPTKKGFSLDIHKNPMDKGHELIGTPKQLARYQLVEHYVEEPMNHLSASLVNTVLIMGTPGAGEALLQDYSDKIREIFLTKTRSTDTPLHKERALKAIKEDNEHFQPRLWRENEGKLVQVKDDLYRLPNTIIDALALFYRLQPSSTWNRIDELFNQNLLYGPSSEYLKRALSFAALLRLKAYSLYHAQHENVDPLSYLFGKDRTPSGAVKEYIGFNSKEIDVLQEIYKTLIPLHGVANEFSQLSGDNNLFQTEALYDDSYFVLGLMSARLCQYEQAVEYYKLALSQLGAEKFTPKFATLNIFIGSMCQIQGQYDDALRYYDAAFKVQKNIYGDSHSTIALNLYNIGVIHKEKGEFDKALTFLDQSLTMQIKTIGKNQPGVAYVYNAIGIIQQIQEQYDDAMISQQEALKILRSIPVYGENHPEIANIMNSIGAIYNQKGQYSEALNIYNKNLIAQKKALSSNHPSVATTINLIGLVYFNLKEHQTALAFYEEALDIRVAIYSDGHADVAQSHNNIGDIYYVQNQYDKALNHYEKCLVIQQSKLGSNHPNVAQSYNNIANCYYKQNILDKALENYKQCLIIDRLSYDDNHHNIAYTLRCIDLASKGLQEKSSKLSSLGKQCYLAKKYDNALLYFEKALALREQTNNDKLKEADIATSNYNLGSTYFCMQQYVEAKPYLQTSFDMRVQLFDSDNIATIKAKNRLEESERAQNLTTQPQIFALKNKL